MNDPDDVIAEVEAEHAKQERERTPNDFFVDVTFRRLRRSKADEIIDAAAKINGRVTVSTTTSDDQIIRGSNG